MYRKSSNFLDYGIEADIEPKIKFNLLISATISTIMCLAAKCPIPKSNVETTKLFLGTITDDEGGRPRNVKVLLSLLNSYTGPYEAEVSKENASERNDQEKSVVEKDRLCIEYDNPIKSSQSSAEIYSSIQVGDSQIPLAKRISRVTTKRSEKETKRLAKTVSLKVTSTKSICK